MNTSRRIATLAAFPVALGIALAAPAMASAAPSSTPDSAGIHLTTNNPHGSNLGLNLNGLLSLGGNRHHDDGDYYRGLDLNLLLSLDLNLGRGHHRG